MTLEPFVQEVLRIRRVYKEFPLIAVDIHMKKVMDHSDLKEIMFTITYTSRGNNPQLGW